MRLIDADAASELVGLEEFTETLNMMPTVDAKPVTHAHWIDEGEDPNDPDSGNHVYLCSRCGHRDTSSESVEVPYCWFCGAKMDKEAQE